MIWLLLLPLIYAGVLACLLPVAMALEMALGGPDKGGYFGLTTRKGRLSAEKDKVPTHPKPKGWATYLPKQSITVCDEWPEWFKAQHREYNKSLGVK